MVLSGQERLNPFQKNFIHNYSLFSFLLDQNTLIAEIPRIDDNMNLIKRKWQLIGKAIIIVLILILIRMVIDYYNLDVITINPIISALVTGVIFTIAVIFTGTLTDYKESEKIPSELAASIRSLYLDPCMFPNAPDDIIKKYKNHVRDFYQVVVTNFKSNTWDTHALHQASLVINQDIAVLAAENVAPPILVKMRNELTNIDKIINRITQIKETDFIPAAYAISETSIVFVIVILLFIKNESMIEASILIAAITAMILGLFMLIKDMDDPFEVGEDASADVDLFLLFDLEPYLND